MRLDNQIVLPGICLHYLKFQHSTVRFIPPCTYMYCFRAAIICASSVSWDSIRRRLSTMLKASWDIQYWRAWQFGRARGSYVRIPLFLPFQEVRFLVKIKIQLREVPHVECVCVGHGGKFPKGRWWGKWDSRSCLTDKMRSFSQGGRFSQGFHWIKTVIFSFATLLTAPCSSIFTIHLAKIIAPVQYMPNKYMHVLLHNTYI